MCTDCKFCIHTSKTCEISQLVDEVICIEKGINNVKNFYLAFDRRVKMDKTIKDTPEVLVETDYFRKQYTNIFEDYESLKEPNTDQLLEIESRVFEFRNSIQRGYTYNLLLKAKYREDLIKRQRHIKEIKQMEEIEEGKDAKRDPKGLLMK